MNDGNDPREMTPEEDQAFAEMQAADELASAEPVEPDEAGLEPEEEEPAEPEPARGRQRTVPHQALHDERERRKVTERENAALREERARFDERLRVIQELNQRQRAAAEQAPDPDQDPFGYMKWVGREVSAAKQSVQQAQARAQQSAAAGELSSAYRADAAAFANTVPDFMPAYQHLVQLRDQELAAVGFGPAERKAMIERDEMTIAAAALRQGKSAAATIYDIARTRGFGGGADAGAAGRVAGIANGQARNRSLSQAGGQAAPTEMTAERLLKMSNDEFDAWTRKHPAQTKRLMGG